MPFPLDNYDLEKEGLLQQLNDEYGEPVEITLRDSERPAYEQWPENGELLSRQKYKYDNSEYPPFDYGLLEDPEFMNLVAEELYNMVYREVLKEKLAEFISELSQPRDEFENEAAPVKRTKMNDFFKYYVTTENDLPGIRRRSGFGPADQYLLDEGSPLNRHDTRKRWGGFKDDRPRRAFAKSSGILDQDVVNKKGISEGRGFQDFDWDDLQQLVKKSNPYSDGYDEQYAPPIYGALEDEFPDSPIPDGGQYRRIGWGGFPEEDLRDPRKSKKTSVDPIPNLVGPFAGYNMFGRLIAAAAAGKRVQAYEDEVPFIDQQRRYDEALDEADYDRALTKLDSVEDYSDSVQDGDFEGDVNVEDQNAERPSHFWDVFIDKFDELADIPKQENSEVAEAEAAEANEEVNELVNDADNNLDGMLAFPMDDEDLPEITEFDPEEDEVTEEDETTEEAIDEAKAKARLRLQILELLKKFEELRRR
ncbi:uncharacterized protein LOC100372691 [Saccoglossus kowalevskii]|uniref:Uncharacterized protein LOC100372691 n=1 Tax=Saccoglossus kowalevskii TaxID=10224 RepID=A0ABM0GXX7_SACKO|nr:PREDICTED: uncharacterized protein LOC100372691 [Saccoglossus kowalevskii]